MWKEGEGERRGEGGRAFRTGLVSRGALARVREEDVGLMAELRQGQSDVKEIRIGNSYG